MIINADDFGLNKRNTEAICKAFRNGIITDSTWIANGEAFDFALEKIESEQLQTKIGIHFNLTEEKPITESIATMSNFVSEGRFHGKINRNKPLSKEEQRAVYEELSAQVMRIERTGIHITHADSHHHIHTALYISPIIIRVCKEHRINKIRLNRNIGDISTHKLFVKQICNSLLHMKGFTTTRFFGSMDDIERDGLKDLLEIMVHPDFDEHGHLIDRVYEESGEAKGNPLKLPSGNPRLFSYREL